MSQSFSECEKLDATMGNRFPSDSKILILFGGMVFPRRNSKFWISLGVGGTNSSPRRIRGAAMYSIPKQTRSRLVMVSGDVSVAGAFGLRIRSCPWLIWYSHNLKMRSLLLNIPFI